MHHDVKVFVEKLDIFFHDFYSLNILDPVGQSEGVSWSP